MDAKEKPERSQVRLTLPSDNEILITRDFRARASSLYDAWTNPKWIEAWYGCDAMKMSVCDVDLREGGKWRWGLHDQSGTEHVFSGSYLALARPTRLVFSERYELVPDSDHRVEVTFEEQPGGVTRLAMRIIHRSKMHRDGHLSSGMENGLQASWDRMADVVERQAA